MRITALLIFATLLAACGVDGAPRAPVEQPKTGITGTATIGVTHIS